MSGVTFHRERLAEAMDDLPSLIAAHWLEIGADQDIPVAPEVEAYLAMEDAGLLRFYAARQDGTLVGFATFFVRFHPHYRDSLQAVNDVHYLMPECRIGLAGFTFLSFCDRQLREEGVQVVRNHVNVRADHGAMLERLGYELVEYHYERRLDRTGA